MKSLKVFCGSALTGLCFLSQNIHKTSRANCQVGAHRKKDIKGKNLEILNSDLHLVVLPQFSRDEDGLWLTQVGLNQIETIKTSIFDAIGSKIKNTRIVFPELNGVKTETVKDIRKTFEFDLSDTSSFLGFNEPFLSKPITILGEPYYQKEQLENMEDSPTLFQQWARVEAAFRSLLLHCEKENMVIVAPQATIAYLFCRILQLPSENWALFSFAHGSITSLRVSEKGDIRVIGVGQTKSFVPDHEKVCLTFQSAETVKLEMMKPEECKQDENLQTEKIFEDKNET